MVNRFSSANVPLTVNILLRIYASSCRLGRATLSSDGYRFDSHRLDFPYNGLPSLCPNDRACAKCFQVTETTPGPRDSDVKVNDQFLFHVLAFIHKYPNFPHKQVPIIFVFRLIVSACFDRAFYDSWYTFYVSISFVKKGFVALHLKYALYM